MQFHAGRLIDHVHINVADLDKAAAFYAAVLEALELPPGNVSSHAFQADELYISRPGPGQHISTAASITAPATKAVTLSAGISHGFSVG